MQKINFSDFILLALTAAAFFFVGRCTAPSETVTEEVIVEKEVIKEVPIEIDPVPEPTTKPKVIFRTVKDEKELAELKVSLREERETFAAIVREKDRLIASLEDELPGIGGVGVEVGNDGGIGTAVVEEFQNPNYYEVEEQDTATGVKLYGMIPVLGTLIDQEPPSFMFVYPEKFKSTTRTDDRTRNRAIGISVAARQDWGGIDRTAAAAGIHYRRGAWLVGGRAWADTDDLSQLNGAEVFTGLEIGWRGKRNR